MENQYNTSMKSRILSLQKAYLERTLERQLKRAGSQEEANTLISEFFKRYYMNAGSPLMIDRYAEEGHLPYVEEYNLTMEEIHNDLSILFQETGLIGDAMTHNFNYAQNERIRIRNRIQKISGSANDLSLISSDNTKNSMYFKDSFDNRNLMEDKMIIGTPVDISTEQGVVTLKRLATFNQSKNATIKLIEGDGTAGTYHLAKQQSIPTASENYSVRSTYISDETPNDNVLSILDGRPDTTFEYQMVNIPKNFIQESIKGYDVGWIKGDQFGDRLRLRIVIELETHADVNWININPYHAAGSTGNVKVYSIRTSLDGFEYQALYDVDDYVLNAEINITPQTYRAQELFDGSDDMRKSKFAGQGVWSFSPRRTRFVEIVLDQEQSYEELIGHTYYERVVISINPTTNAQTETRTRIPSSQVNQKVIDAPNGRYPVGDAKNVYIDKKIEVFKGWRYAIGIRDINIMSYEYAPKSEIISKRYVTDQPIRHAMLYVNEKIPQEFLDVIAKGNEWIKYYVSHDDVNWHRISPMHHHPLGKENEFPAKILEFTTTATEQQDLLQIHKQQITVEKPIHGLRFKAVMERPTNKDSLKQLTPILEDYSLRVVLDET